MTDHTRKLHIPGIMRNYSYTVTYSLKVQSMKNSDTSEDILLTDAFLFS